MAATDNLEDLEAVLHELGYGHLGFGVGDRGPRITGNVYGIDTENAEKSAPEGKQFKTFDNADELIPDDIIEAAERHGATAQVLGHGPNRLHLHIAEK